MNCLIPFTKDIKFKTNISEILSISLEHDYTLNDNNLLGNFLITGEYKTHEVSVNKEKFEYSLPFSVALTNRIDAESLDFNIEDFTYDVIDNNTLRVEIEYSLKAKELPKEDEVVFERVDEKEDTIDDLIIEPVKEDEEIREEKIEDVKEETENTLEINEEKTNEEETKDEVSKEAREEANIENDKETVLNSINADDNNFVTYHIHILKENETIETVCSLYNTTTNVIGEYNDVSNLTIGDKIIIPNIDE